MTRRGGEDGYSLVALMAALTIAAILMAAALPTWRYLIKDDREQELIFRGTQIVNAITCYNEKTKTAPIDLASMVKQHCLRKAYKDPMTKDGKWRFLRPGENIPGGAPPGLGKSNIKSLTDTTDNGDVQGPTPPTTEPSSRLGAPAGTTVGAIAGVASTSREKSIRIFNGKTRYSEWAFTGDPLKWTIGSQRPGGPTPPTPKSLNATPTPEPVPTAPPTPSDSSS